MEQLFINNITINIFIDILLLSIKRFSKFPSYKYKFSFSMLTSAEIQNIYINKCKSKSYSGFPSHMLFQASEFIFSKNPPHNHPWLINVPNYYSLDEQINTDIRKTLISSHQSIQFIKLFFIYSNEKRKSEI